ncbi:hypothetical protein PsorP6_005498 [Peronosclerospora sorghi]|uniref:Uncharacterized protein n=1 Tax=Peronosclerospora sorghi TaxID=230839 RepID=A0ACC0W323_9STRA|nr:hypothetical protein PsorP6_005498 [Peronosclerospora sorghi]
MSERFCDSFYDKSKYFLPKHAGDHLAHSVSFRSGTQLHGRGYWKFPRYLLDYPLVVSAIEKETELVRENIRIAQNTGKVWEKWKLDIKAQLQDIQKKLRQQDTQDVADARVLLDQAAARYRVYRNPVWGSEMGDAESPSGTALAPDELKQLMLLESVSRFVSDTDRDMPNAALTAADLANAIQHMRATSSPGMDGLTAEFYQVTPDVFGECLQVVFSDRLRRGVLLMSQRKSAVVLLHKKGSRDETENYTPIALVPVDAKVLSKALTYRLQNVMLDLIDPDQKGFVKVRSIHQHVRFLDDLQDIITSRDEEAYALFLDFQKAFDRVKWEYMFRLLIRMGFGHVFIQWIKMLYTKPQAHLLLNGNIQPALYPTRGARQGDPYRRYYLC